MEISDIEVGGGGVGGWGGQGGGAGYDWSRPQVEQSQFLQILLPGV